MNQQEQQQTWSKRFIELLEEATFELWKHSDRLPIDADDPDRNRAAAEHLRALLDILNGGPARGCFVATMPERLRELILQRCDGDLEAARRYVIEAAWIAVRMDIQPHELGIGLRSGSESV